MHANVTKNSLLSKPPSHFYDWYAAFEIKQGERHAIIIVTHANVTKNSLLSKPPSHFYKILIL